MQEFIDCCPQSAWLRWRYINCLVKLLPLCRRQRPKILLNTHGKSFMHPEEPWKGLHWGWSLCLSSFILLVSFSLNLGSLVKTRPVPLPGLFLVQSPAEFGRKSLGGPVSYCGGGMQARTPEGSSEFPGSAGRLFTSAP